MLQSHNSAAPTHDDPSLINPVHLKPLQYAHIIDNNSNVTRLVEGIIQRNKNITHKGPQTLTLLAHETLVYGPVPFIQMPPDHYCLIENPIIKNKNQPTFDSFGQVKN